MPCSGKTFGKGSGLGNSLGLGFRGKLWSEFMIFELFPVLTLAAYRSNLYALSS